MTDTRPESEVAVRRVGPEAAAEVRAREDLFDLFVDLSARSITIADHAAADMKLCTFR